MRARNALYLACRIGCVGVVAGARPVARRSTGGGCQVPPGYRELRIVAIPSAITPDLASHTVTYAAPGDDGLVFTSSGGGPLRRSNFCRRVWHPALRADGFPPIHFHDLRRTGKPHR